jgi:PST family polysaccharide transporter
VLISGLALQHAALLNRDMRFGRSSAIEVINALAGFFAAALLALLFRNYWALVLGPLTGLAIQTVLTWRSINWVPGRISFSEARRFARFGSGVTGYNLVSFVSRNADNILIAKVVGTASLGIYDRSYKLMMLPLQTLNGPVNRLLFPLLSRLQDDPERYRRTFVFAVRAVGLLTIPGIAIAAALSQRLMPFLLGHAWTAAGPIFFWLGLAGLFNPIGNMTTLLFLTSGRTDAFFRFGLFSTIVTVAAFGVGVRWGGEGVAASLFFTTALRTPLLFLYSVRQTGVRASDLFGAQFEPLLAAALSAAVALEIEPYLETGQLLSVAFPIAYTIGIVLALATQPGRHAVFRIFTIAQDSITRISTRMHSMFVRTD